MNEHEVVMILSFASGLTVGAIVFFFLGFLLGHGGK